MTDDELLARLDAWHKEGGSQTAGDAAARLRELIAERDEAGRIYETLIELLTEVMGEGVEYTTSKYAIVQMSLSLRCQIRDVLAEIDAALAPAGEAQAKE